MAEEENEQDGEQPDALDEPKGAWLKQFVVLAVVVLIGQSIIAYVLVSYQIIPWYFGEEEEAMEKVSEVQETKREPVPVEPPILYAVDEMTVNPQDYHTIRYLNIKMSLELDAPETLALLEGDPVTETKLFEVIRNALNTTNYRELDDAEERGPLRLKLVAAINASELLNEGSVSNVYFERFIAQ